MNTTVGPKATRKEWIGLAVLALPCLLYSMDLTVLLLAVPHLTADLKPSASQLLWITDIYGFLIAGLLITMGTLGDRIGRRKLLMCGAVAFGAASLLAAFSPTAEMLIAARALLGVAGATLAPSTLSLIRNMFHDEQQRTFAIGVWVACFSGGSALGPVIGGMMLEHFWWGSVFLMAVPVMVLLLVLGPILLPESKDENAGRLEIASVVMSISAVLSIIYGAKKMAEMGWGLDYALIILFGIMMGVAFVKRQRKLAYPLVDVALFKQPGFTAALCINIIGLFMVFGYFLMSAQYMQLVLGLSPLKAGLWMLPTSVSFIIGSMVAPILVRHISRIYIMVGSFILAAISFYLLAHLGSFPHVGVFVAILTLFCFAVSPIGILTTDMVLSIAPPERAGAASAISETSFEFGGAFGIAVLGSVVMVFYKKLMQESVPEGTPATAYDTLASALDLAQHLPADQGPQLAIAAQSAFVTSMELISWLSMAATLLAALMTYVLLKPYAQLGRN
jgi:DHA2 family multidrug resistance protein-like MFS transporter